MNVNNRASHEVSNAKKRYPDPSADQRHVNNLNGQ
jgi:hypothetical protein